MYTMATVVFGRTDEQFWDMTPRLLTTMIAEWNQLELGRAKLQGLVIAAYMNGKNPDDYLVTKKPERAKIVSQEQRERNARMLF